jgi:hypothetical protein
MCEELKFGAVAGRGLKATRETSTSLAVACSLDIVAPAAPRLGAPNLAATRATLQKAELLTPITDYCSPATAFLIDTLAIRNTPKSFVCSIAAQSNRHSPATPECTYLKNFDKLEIRSILGILPSESSQSSIQWCASTADCAKVHSSVLGLPQVISSGNGLIQEESDL